MHVFNMVHKYLYNNMLVGKRHGSSTVPRYGRTYYPTTVLVVPYYVVRRVPYVQASTVSPSYSVRKMWSSRTKECRVLVLGLDGAGKSSVVRRLKYGLVADENIMRKPFPQDSYSAILY